MTTTIEISGWLEEQLERLVEIGLYSTKSEAVRDAIRRFIETLDMPSIALKLYRMKGISLGLAAEIANKTYEEMITYMITKGIIPELGEPDINTLLKQYKILMDRRLNTTFIVDYSTLSLMYHTGLVDYIDKMENSEFYIPSQLLYSLRLLNIKRLVLYRSRSSTKIFTVKSLNRKINSSSVKRQGITLYEYEAIMLARELNSILVSEDIRVRRKARDNGVEAISSLAIILNLRDLGILRGNSLVDIVERAKSYPIAIPLELEI